jgi:hypothetical protein
MRVAQSHANIRPSEDRSQRERIGPAVGHASCRRVTQVMKPKVLKYLHRFSPYQTGT